MKVLAAGKGSGKDESITIKIQNGRLSQEESDRMMTEAKEPVAEDEEQRTRIEVMNSL